MIGWLAVKIAANWGRFSPEGQRSLEDQTRYAFSVLVAGLVSMFFALIGGLIAGGEIALGELVATQNGEIRDMTRWKPQKP